MRDTMPVSGSGAATSRVGRISLQWLPQGMSRSQESARKRKVQEPCSEADSDDSVILVTPGDADILPAGNFTGLGDIGLVSAYGARLEFLPECLQQQKYLLCPLLKFIPRPVQDCTCEAESMARRCLEAGVVHWHQLKLLLTQLEVASPKRWNRVQGQMGMSSPRSFYAGAWSRGPLKGLTKTMRTHPNTTALLANVIRALDASFCFTSVTLALNIQSPPHKDAQNNKEHDNLLLPCSRWTGGQLWLQDPEGSIALCHDGPLGKFLETDAPTRFHPHSLHATAPWSGDRLVLIGYHANHVQQLPSEDYLKLLFYGFHPEKRSR